MLPTEIPGSAGATGAAVAAIGGLPGLESWLALFRGNWRAFFQLWLDPFDVWFTRVFSGRPKVGHASATDSIALFLLQSPNPVLRLWGIGIRLQEARGIPLSTGNPIERQRYIHLAEAVLTDLRAQFPNSATSIWNHLGTLVLHCDNPASNRRCIASRATYVDQPYNQAVASGWIDPATGFPFPPAAGCCR